MWDLGLHDELLKAFNATQVALHKVQYDIEVQDTAKVMYDLKQKGVKFVIKYSIYENGNYITKQQFHSDKVYDSEDLVKKLISFYKIELNKTYKVMVEIVDIKGNVVYFIKYDGYVLAGKCI